MFSESNSKGMSKNNAASNIKVVGIGGFGGRIVERLLSMEITGLEFVVINTDRYALRMASCPDKIPLGPNGIGEVSVQFAGQSAEDSRETIKKALLGSRVVFLIAGMGGSTGAGAIPAVAAIAKEMGIPTVSVVTMPFDCEGKRKIRSASQAVENLRNVTDRLVIAPCSVYDANGEIFTIPAAFEATDIAVCHQVQSLVTLERIN